MTWNTVYMIPVNICIQTIQVVLQWCCRMIYCSERTLLQSSIINLTLSISLQTSKLWMYNLLILIIWQTCSWLNSILELLDNRQFRFPVYLKDTNYLSIKSTHYLDPCPSPDHQWTIVLRSVGAHQSVSGSGPVNISSASLTETTAPQQLSHGARDETNNNSNNSSNPTDLDTISPG